KIDDLSRVTPRNAFEFAIRKHRRVADHSAFRAAERNTHHRAFPGHPGRQCAHLIQRHVRGETNAALAWTSRDRVLHAVAREYFDPSVIELHGDGYGDFL